MLFFSRSRSRTVSYAGSGMPPVSPRMLIQPVPRYSQYMSISPDSIAVRTASEPASPIWSLTVAPLSSSASLVMLPSTSCSVNSLEPTVYVWPEKSKSWAMLPPPPPPPPPPQPTATIATAATSVRYLNKLLMDLAAIQLLLLEAGCITLRGDRLQPLRPQDVLGHASQPVYEQGQNRGQNGAGHQYRRAIQGDAGLDQGAQPPGPDERRQRRGTDGDNQRGPNTGEHDRHGQRQLDAEQNGVLGHPHPPPGLDDGPVHLPQPDHRVAQYRQERVGDQSYQRVSKAQTEEDRQQGEHPDGRQPLADIRHVYQERRDPTGKRPGEQHAGGDGQHDYR